MSSSHPTHRPTRPPRLRPLPRLLRHLRLSDAQKLITETARIAHSDIRRVFGRDGKILSGKALPDDIAPAVSSIKRTKKSYGSGKDMRTEETVELRFWDKIAALN